jgi:hypothetical protein
MTKKEKILISTLKSSNKFSVIGDKDILKYLHATNPVFENLSPFDWEKHNGNKRFKVKIKNLK